jgi:hypothetical protein
MKFKKLLVIIVLILAVVLWWLTNSLHSSGGAAAPTMRERANSPMPKLHSGGSNSSSQLRVDSVPIHKETLPNSAGSIINAAPNEIIEASRLFNERNFKSYRKVVTQYADTISENDDSAFWGWVANEVERQQRVGVMAILNPPEYSHFLATMMAASPRFRQMTLLLTRQKTFLLASTVIDAIRNEPGDRCTTDILGIMIDPACGIEAKQKALAILCLRPLSKQQLETLDAINEQNSEYQLKASFRRTIAAQSTSLPEKCKYFEQLKTRILDGSKDPEIAANYLKIGISLGKLESSVIEILPKEVLDPKQSVFCEYFLDVLSVNPKS